MARQLKVYNRFDELILHLRFVPEDPSPYQVIEGSRELREAVCGLYGQDFDRTVIEDGQQRRFVASWASPEYVDTLAGYWASNFRWRTETTSDEFEIEIRNTGLVPSAHSVGFGGTIYDRGAVAGGLTDPYVTGLATLFTSQGKAESNFGLAVGMVPQGGSACGATISAPG